MSTNYGFEPTLDGLNNIDADSSTTTNIICDTIQINTSGTAPTMSPGDNTTNIATTAYVDNATTGVFVDLTTTQTITGQKTFSNANTFITGNTVTNSIKSVINNNLVLEGVGTGDAILRSNLTDRITCFDNGRIDITGSSGQPMNISTTGTMTLQSASNTNINIGNNQTSGIINLGLSSSRTGAVNIASLTTLNAPITIGSLSSTTQTVTHNALSTFNKLVVVADGILQRWGLSTSGLILGKTNINEITAKLLDSLDVLYFQTSTGTNIMYLNSTDIFNILPTTFSSTTTHTGGATFNGLSTFNNDILVQQSTYPSTNDSQLGYTLTVAGTAGNTTTNVWKTLNQIDVPSKGVWLFVGLYQLDIAAGQPGDIEQLRFGLSSVAPVSFTRVSNIEYYRETDDSVGLNDLRDRVQVSGVFTTTASATYYFSARLRYTGFVASDIQTKGDSTLTRIG